MSGAHVSGMSVARRRRRRRAAITLTIVGLLLLGVFAYAAAYWQGWIGKEAAAPTPTPTCTSAQTVAPIAPTKVSVNVYNATDRNGLAAGVAAQLRKQGFKVAKVANDPLGRSIEGTGEVRYGPKGVAAGVTVRQRLSSAQVRPDNRVDATVDLVLGQAYQKLTVPPKPPRPAPARTTTRATAKPTGGATAKPTSTSPPTSPSTPTC
ncbi:MAG TPA: LytR C-terminal domain-containing protein [Dermatophilaceae bacterium]|nr:LytR C-terminal domain-containing protein [Dermatophilaceae bacterium]